MLLRVLVFFLVFISYLQLDAQTQMCLSCKGSGHVYVTRKVPKSTTTTYESYGSLPHMVRSSTYTEYGNEGGYEDCYRCNGSGRVSYTKPTTPAVNKKVVKLKNTDYILASYKKKKPNHSHKIETLENPLNNMHVVTSKRDKSYSYDIVLSNGNNHSILYSSGNYDSYQVLTKGDGSFFALLVETKNKTYIHDKYGKLIDSFTEKVYYISPSYFWVEEKNTNKKEKQFKLISYPSKSPLFNKTFPISRFSSCQDLLDNHGLIDVKIKDSNSSDNLYGVINTKGETIIPFTKNQLVGCDIGQPYIYFIDKNNDNLLKYNYNGYLEYGYGNEKDLNHGIKGVEIKKAYWVNNNQKNHLNFLNDKTKIETHTMLISEKHPHLNGFAGGDMSKFDSDGWASFKKIKNERQQEDRFFLHKSGFLCSTGDNDFLTKFYNAKHYHFKYSKDTFQVKVNGKTFDEEYDLEIIRKGKKVGANYDGAGAAYGKKYEFKAKYLDIKELSGNILGLKNTKNKWQIQILFGKANGNHKTGFEFDSVLSSNYLYTFGKKNGVWHKIFLEEKNNRKKKITTVKIADIAGDEKEKTIAVLAFLKAGIDNRYLIDKLVTYNISSTKIKQTKVFKAGTQIELTNGEFYFHTSNEKGYGGVIKLDKAYKDYRANYGGCIGVLNEENKWNLILTSGTILDTTTYSFDHYFYKKKKYGYYAPILENELGGFTITIVDGVTTLSPLWLNQL